MNYLFTNPTVAAKFHMALWEQNIPFAFHLVPQYGQLEFILLDSTDSQCADHLWNLLAPNNY